MCKDSVYELNLQFATRSAKESGNDIHHNSLMTWQGLPTATTLDGISLVTTDPAPIVTLSPMVTPGRMVTLPPIHTLLPIVTGSAHSLRVFLLTGSVL